MADPNKSDNSREALINRRQLLKTLGISSVGITGLATATTSVEADDSEWNCNNGCPQEEVETKQLDLPDPAGSNETLEGAVSIHWKESGWSSEKGKWFHIFSVSGGSSSETSGILGGHVYGQHYRLETSDGDIQPSTEGDKHGVFPCNDSDVLIPDWGAPLLEAAIGTLSVGASWFLAVNESLREKLGRRPNGFSIFGGGFEYGDMATSLTSPTPWMRSSFFHRVEIETSEFSPVIDVKMGFCHHDSAATTLWEDLEGELVFFGDPGNPGFSSQSKSKQEPNPAEMSAETKEKYGIKKVTEEQTTITPQSTEDDVSIDYIATKSPLSVNNLEVTQADESEMENPRSERFRERLNKTAPYNN